MKHLLVVEDNPYIAEQLKQYIQKIDSTINIFTTGYAEEAYNIAQLYPIDAFFLDIQLMDFSGLELAEKLRDIKGYKNTIMVFITGMVSREIEAFKQYHCYDYILKPFSEETIEKMFNEVIKECLEAPQFHEAIELKIKQKNHNYLVKQKEIVFIESLNRKLYVNLQDKTIEFTMTSLKELKKDLSPIFIQCHRSFIVNRYYIEYYNSLDDYLKLQHYDKLIPVGRKYRPLIKEYIQK